MTFFKKSAVTALCAAFVFGLFLGCSPVRAQEDAQGLMPSASAAETEAVPGQETHPPMRLTPDKSEILTLNEDVERVIIGNEIHLNILMDTTRRLVIVPRVPGATYFTILGENGKILMQRYAIIAAPEQKYVRIRQPCLGEDKCMPIRMFYCPDMCHEVSIPGEGNTSFSSSIATLGEDSKGSEKSTGTTNTGLTKTYETNTQSSSSSEGEQ